MAYLEKVIFTQFLTQRVHVSFELLDVTYLKYPEGDTIFKMEQWKSENDRTSMALEAHNRQNVNCPAA